MRKELKLGNGVKAIIRWYARKEDEVCGLLLGHGDIVTDVVELTNVSRSPSVIYEMDHEELIEAINQYGWEDKKRKVTILGRWHSHVCKLTTPSSLDLKHMGKATTDLIYCVPLDKFNAFAAKDEVAVPITLL